MPARPIRTFTVLPHLPERLRDRRYYEPTERGHERTIRERLAAWRAKRSGN